MIASRHMLLAFALVVTACGQAAPTVTGGGTDAGVDGGHDAGVDAGVDAGSDGGTDAGMDAGLDAGFDGGMDAGMAGGCRVDTDCCSSRSCAPTLCVYPGEVLCGGPARQPPASDCDGGDSCPTGQRCFQQPPPDCITNPAPYFLCETPCSVTGCDAGMLCDVSGQCVPESCTTGYACPAPTTCNPDVGEPDVHGCTLSSCRTDADCGGLYCVQGFCRTALGQCEPAPI